MIGAGFIYTIAGLMFAAFAVLTLARTPGRWANGGFYALLAASFLGGDRFGDIGNGVLVLGLIALAATGRMRGHAHREPAVEPPARGLLPLALVIPGVALAGTILFKFAPALVEPAQATLVALTAGVLIALGCGYLILRPRPLAPFTAGARLMDEIGWAAVLPQMLASLGAVFALAGMGQAVGGLFGAVIPAGNVFAAVVAYTIGMAAFTMLMGNAFAAFPVMAGAIGLPLLVHAHGADPARVAAIGMLAGFSGTLMTPMAANFNIVPAALLDLRDKGAVIRAQVPTAIPLLVFNTLLLYLVIR